MLLVFNTHSPPNVGRIGGKFQLAVEKLSHTARSFCKNLVSVPICQAHDPRRLDDELVRHFVLKQIAHGIYKNHSWPDPFERFSELFGHELNIKPMFVRMARNSPKSFRKRFRVVVLEPGLTFLQPRTGFQVASVHSIFE